MARYYNKTSGSLAITLRGGDSLSIPGNSWTEIPAAQEGSEDLIRAVKNDFLYRFVTDEAPAPAPSPVAVVAEPAAPEISAVKAEVKEEQSASVAESEVADEAAQETASEKTSESSRRRKG